MRNYFFAISIYHTNSTIKKSKECTKIFNNEKRDYGLAINLSNYNCNLTNNYAFIIECVVRQIYFHSNKKFQN